MDLPQSMKLVGGMGAVGAGAGLIGVLIDAIRSERRRVRAVEGKDDEGALELYLPPGEKKAVMADVVAGVGAATLSAYAVQALYKKWKAQQLQRETEEAALGYLEDVTKTANDGIGAMDVLTGIPRDLFYLAPLLAAGGTYGLLEQAFPRVKTKAKAGLPRKIKIKGYGRVAVDGPGDGPLGKPHAGEAGAAEADEAGLKTATFTYGEDDQRRCAESLCLMLLATPALKEAASALPDILGAYHGDPLATMTILKEAGFLAAVAASRGWGDSFHALGEGDKRAAVHAALHEGALAPSLALTALAEFNEIHPAYAKIARWIADDPELSILHTKLASVMHLLDTAASLERAPHVKFAKAWRDELETLSMDSGEDVNGEVNSADAAHANRKDPIDAFMAGQTKFD